ncbi:stress response NST1-like protein [Thalictrum thalictroides]|uniref:Stress response NST1-like protein n=1 Tax=Thalictrum thalictroides TaxID=46969 RepID=A0A7J6UU33_THATH|nr:stress response NST1-like protein [Thalictrum thalictroides]
MDSMGCIQAPQVRKGKKKQAKDEVDRLKQAEKKKRRLEKALAISAAIRSELEKKKQKKKEEQQRLDEEGAAIAEAVAMHVLLEEDSDDSCKIVLQRDEGFNPWNCTSNIGLLMGGRKAGSATESYRMYSVEGLGRVSDAYGMGRKWNDRGIGSWTFSPDIFGIEGHAPYFEDKIRVTTEISAGLIAAQAVSSLQIAEDAHADSIFINRMLRR